MPVVNVRLEALKRIFPGYPLTRLIDEIPYLGLDIEALDEQEGIVKIEFNPNRPDFASYHFVIQ